MEFKEDKSKLLEIITKLFFKKSKNSWNVTNPSVFLQLCCFLIWETQDFLKLCSGLIKDNLIFGAFRTPQQPELEPPQRFPVPSQLGGQSPVFFPWIYGFLGPVLRIPSSAIPWIPLPGGCRALARRGCSRAFVWAFPISCAEIASTWECIFKGLSSSDVFEIGCKWAPSLAAGISGRQPTGHDWLLWLCLFEKKLLKDSASIN